MNWVVFIFTTVLISFSHTENYFALPFILLVVSFSKAKTAISKDLVRVVSPLFAIMLLGIISSPSNFSTIYRLLRDVFYFCQPMIMIFFGASVLSVVKLRYSFILGLICTESYFAFSRILSVSWNPVSLMQIGMQGTYEYGLKFTELLIPTALFFAFGFSLLKSHRLVKLRSVFIIFFSLCMILSLSRTVLLTLLLYFLATIPRFFKLMKKYVISITIFLLIAIIYGGQFLKLNDSSNSAEGFKEKLSGSISELVVRDMSRASQINSNFRSFEAHLGMNYFLKGDVVNMLVGHGFGSYVSPPYSLWQGEKLNEIPVFHNGFITILVKTGLIGLLLYLIFFMRLLRLCSVYENREISYIILLIVITLVVDTFLTHGLYYTRVDYAALILIGSIINTHRKNDSKKGSFLLVRR